MDTHSHYLGLLIECTLLWVSFFDTNWNTTEVVLLRKTQYMVPNRILGGYISVIGLRNAGFGLHYLETKKY